MIVFGDHLRAPLELVIGPVPPESQFIGRITEDGSGIVAFSECRGRGLEIHAAGTGSWLTRQLVEICWFYAFKQAECRRVTAVIATDNKRSRTLVERIGFKHEGTLRRGFHDCDAELYGLLKEDCKHVRRIEQATSGT